MYQTRERSSQNGTYHEIEYPNAIYKGEVYLNTLHGKGTMVYTSGGVYIGMWSNNQKCGPGIMQFANGDTYSGYWEDNGMHGFGTYTWANGDMYQGHWAQSLQNGEGKYAYKDEVDKYFFDWISIETTRWYNGEEL